MNYSSPPLNDMQAGPALHFATVMRGSLVAAGLQESDYLGSDGLYGRPAIPTDQAWIESFFGHIKSEWPHLEAITDPAAFDVDRQECERNTTQLDSTRRSDT